MKTSEYRKPWEENHEEQKIDQQNLSKAKNQLQRDILRFAELLPDSSLTGRIHFRCFAAFPFVEEEIQERNGCNILSRPDFESTEKLNQRILLQKTTANCNRDLFKASIGRYLGLHSVIPLKHKDEMFKEEQKSIDDNRSKVEAAICHSPTTDEYLQLKDEFASSFPQKLRVKLSGVKALQKIFDAIDKTSYRNGSFKKQFVNYPVDVKGEFDIEKTSNDSPYPFRRKSSKKPILIGKQQIKIAIEHLDAKLGHEGFERISGMLNDESVEIFELQKDESQRNRFERITSSGIITLLNWDCEECTLKDTLRQNGKHHEGRTTLTATDDVSMALEFADYHHQGFHKALGRLRNWCHFEDMEEKVFVF